MSNNMSRRLIDLQACDDIRIYYEGHFKNEKMFAITITSRTLYRDCRSFREEFYKFLSNIGYKYCINGIMEFHEKSSKIHVHAIGNFGCVPKDNKNNDFYFKVNRLTDLDGWIDYLIKASSKTLEKDSEERAGIIDIHRKKICLFDKDD